MEDGKRVFISVWEQHNSMCDGYQAICCECKWGSHNTYIWKE